MGKISFLPAQLDGALATSAREARMSPLGMIARDMMTMIQNAAYLPMVMMPWKSSSSFSELHQSAMNIRDCTLHASLLVLEIAMMCMAIPTFLMLPGVAFAALATICCSLIWALSLPLKGPQVVHSKIEIPAALRIEDHKDERWMFINGCCTGNNWLQASCDRLAMTFGRPITGIHNRTHGHLADMMEGIVQRATGDLGASGRVAYDYMKKFALDPAVRKVVVIAHSQGASITSMVLDRLYAELPSKMLGKIEIYTFGSSASQFNNPLAGLDRPKENLSTSAEPHRIIPHIEHYCNEQDMMSRCGVLYNSTNAPLTKYCGRVFMQGGVSGHLFVQHYLETMFPLDQDKRSRFLDEEVIVEEGIAVRRETVGSEDSIGRKKISSNGITNALKISFISAAQVAAENCKGHTVKELSRLWKYMDGKRPMPDPNAATNGVHSETFTGVPMKAHRQQQHQSQPQSVI
ncbi:MAG: hypothetical protein M1814_005923 [Vezdaea aestivalis]|nr:MAG: hypothetical protein M1814_005923 [Vezdaea aestivalis]